MDKITFDKQSIAIVCKNEDDIKDFLYKLYLIEMHEDAMRILTQEQKRQSWWRNER